MTFWLVPRVAWPARDNIPPGPLRFDGELSSTRPARWVKATRKGLPDVHAMPLRYLKGEIELQPSGGLGSWFGLAEIRVVCLRASEDVQDHPRRSVTLHDRLSDQFLQSVRRLFRL